MTLVVDKGKRRSRKYLDYATYPMYTGLESQISKQFGLGCGTNRKILLINELHRRWTIKQTTKISSQGLIRTYFSPSRALVLLSQKKFESFVMYVDYRKLNKLISKSQYPFPKIKWCVVVNFFAHCKLCSLKQNLIKCGGLSEEFFLRNEGFDQMWRIQWIILPTK